MCCATSGGWAGFVTPLACTPFAPEHRSGRHGDSVDSDRTDALSMTLCRPDGIGSPSALVSMDQLFIWNMQLPDKTRSDLSKSRRGCRARVPGSPISVVSLNVRLHALVDEAPAALM
jgi:hypothetical protein